MAKSAKLVWQKEVNEEGTKGFRLIEWDNILVNIPKEYFLNGESFFATGKSVKPEYIQLCNVKWFNNEIIDYELELDEFISAKEFNYIIKHMKKSGDRLSQVNEKIKELKNKWKGKIEIII